MNDATLRACAFLRGWGSLTSDAASRVFTPFTILAHFVAFFGEHMSAGYKRTIDNNTKDACAKKNEKHYGS